MSDIPQPRPGTPSDRLAHSVQAWEKAPELPRRAQARQRRVERDPTTLERAKGAVMLRYGVNSHVALATLTQWSRTAGVSVTTLAGALVDGTPHNDELADADLPSFREWLEERLRDAD